MNVNKKIVLTTLICYSIHRFGSSSRRANVSILSICDFWCNAEGGPKDKQGCVFICF
jgi:hypothetical protein